jgi:hypothetical protein
MKRKIREEMQDEVLNGIANRILFLTEGMHYSLEDELIKALEQEARRLMRHYGIEFRHEFGNAID